MTDHYNWVQRLSTTEVAQVAGCHRDTVIKALESGVLHGTQRVKGGRWLIRPACLDRWMDALPCPHQDHGIVGQPVDGTMYAVKATRGV